ncbi:MAG: glycosyltransferase family 2 protein [Candidatus Omnitrophica bacterium]|nr:glycosyltransferase family 2 protein [Candidatus Omnitrophota bacterium]
MKLSIIIPCYNERVTLPLLIAKIRSATLPPRLVTETIIVDDGSTDGTAEFLATIAGGDAIIVLSNKKNTGKAASIKLGLTRASGDIILIQDADLEYDPRDYRALLGPILNGNAAIVFGSRFKGSIKNMKWYNALANRITSLTMRLLYGISLTDVNTGYKVFKRDVISGIPIESSNFMFETEITARCVKKGYRIIEVPIAYEARPSKEGKKMTFLKALEMYWGLFRYRFR